MILKILRNALGSPLLLLDWLTRPTPLDRDPVEQQAIDAETRKLKLYQFRACPFCIKVRRQMRALSLNIDTVSVSPGEPGREELLAGGGRIQAPCLRIEENGRTEWLYESADIIAYLQERFSESSPTGEQVG